MLSKVQQGAAVLAAAVLALSGCTPAGTAAVATLRLMVPSGTTTDETKLDPAFPYLRVTRGKQVGFAWRGSVEGTPEGLVEVYYTSSGEVVRLRNGRLVGMLGLETEWRRVVEHAPPWSELVNAREPSAFTRFRDVMPGYRSGVRDDLVLVRIATPARNVLLSVDPNTLTWFEERPRRRHSGLRGTPSDVLPPARYALDLSGGEPAVVYSEQCLAAGFCFTWQRWSTALQQVSARAR